MLMDLERTIAYICPMCSGITMRDIRVFNLSGKKPVEFGCDSGLCDEIPVRISQKKDKYQIEVQCPVCDDVHTYTLQPATFWGKKFLGLKCPVSGTKIFFAGTKEEISLDLDKHTALISGIMEDMDVEDELGIMFDIVECINDLSKQQSIYCTCGSRDIAISADDGKIVLRCLQCGKTKEIPATMESLIVLMNSMAIVLEDKK